MWATVNVALPMVTGGKVRGLALAESRPTQSLKDVPVVAETVPGYEVSAWYDVFAPRGTPVAIVQQPDVQAGLLPLGYEISTANAEQLRATVAGDMDKWGKLAKTIGIKPE